MIKNKYNMNIQFSQNNYTFVSSCQIYYYWILLFKMYFLNSNTGQIKKNLWELKYLHDIFSLFFF